MRKRLALLIAAIGLLAMFVPLPASAFTCARPVILNTDPCSAPCQLIPALQKTAYCRMT